MEYLGIILILIGGIFCSVGAFGFCKMPDLYTRMHASGVSDSCGCMLAIIGMIFLNGFNMLSLKLLLLLAILLIMSATTTNILIRTAIAKNITPLIGKITKKK